MADVSKALVPLRSEVERLSSCLSINEQAYLRRAAKLFNDQYYDHALLDLWNAAVCNLRRRVEAYGVELFLSTVKDERSGRKSYVADGDSLNDRWEGVDELVLIAGATRLGLLNRKAGKALEMINWTRNHVSPAHPTEEAVLAEDVYALFLLLQKNLFELPMPEVGHSISALFDPVKTVPMAGNAADLVRDQIRGLRSADVRVAFGFLLDMLSRGENPAFENAKLLLPILWERAPEESKKSAGVRYHKLVLDPGSDDSPDQAARERLLDFLVAVKGVAYIPDAARAAIYRKIAKRLAKAKDSSYGFAAQEEAARALAQFGPHVPAVAFEEVYQEILAVWCGNYWRRSQAYQSLDDFIEGLNTPQIRSVVSMFQNNDRVRSELFQVRPKAQAVALLEHLKTKVSLTLHQDEIARTIDSLEP